ncbi:hypothetical protein O4G76_08395 [Limimaricola sp. G21655-S1]|uniref:hypothetical protein n=1 Tax=Limimaricola sp. G21655-S1 TaxID=3014768 RepID=UPI0022AF6B73|nr:hypothetical protein [Limimaricola sp. G21655-S1]MCZ4260860.1 hypothetical protein [Limimaricola sp. G21655-S1]
MFLTTSRAVACAALFATGAPVATWAQEADPTRVEMVLVQESGQTTAMSVSVAQGPYMETASFRSATAIATGAIASLEPVEKFERPEEGFDLFTSRVGR